MFFKCVLPPHQKQIDYSIVEFYGKCSVILLQKSHTMFGSKTLLHSFCSHARTHTHTHTHTHAY